MEKKRAMTTSNQSSLVEMKRVLIDTNFWNLRKKGQPIPTNDIWVAASAFQHNLALFTLDDHFKRVEGLIIK
jgi:hypothetical protein